MTIFQLSEKIWQEFHKNDPLHLSEEEMAEIEEIQQSIEDSDLELLKNETISRSFEFIKDLVYQLTWEESELLVAGVLRAIGYKTRMSSKGGDGGYDIIASPDGLEMTEPIIKAEVKHKTKSKEKVGAPDIRNFIGGLRNSTKGIYVSTTGFSKDAIQEADRANFYITLIDLDRLVELITEYYEMLDVDTKALVPLKRIYWPL